MRNYTSDLPRAMLRLILDTYRYVRFQSPECRGVYRSFEQAEAAAPRGKKIGYNHEELAKGYLGELNLRVRPGTSSGITKFSEHEADGCEAQECERLVIEILPIFGKPSASVEPSNGSLDQPKCRI